MRKSLLLIAMLFLSIFIQAQTNNDDVFQEFKKTPVAPSPNAAALGKFGEIPVDLSTGLPSITVPFYSYNDKLKGLALNVGISYHAGGHKVEDMASNTGLGWALRAGGMISRTMRGMPDDHSYGYLKTGTMPLLNTTDFSTLDGPGSSLPISHGVCWDNYGNGIPGNQYADVVGVSNSTIDGECDIFSINVGNLSGRFFFKKDLSIQLISQSNLKVASDFSGSGIINNFTVIDELGIKYIFDQTETTTTTSSLGGTPGTVETSYISSWYLSKIISADGLDEINFTYTLENTLSMESGFSESHKSAYLPGSPGYVYASQLSTQTHSFNYITTAPRRLQSISFPDGTQTSFAYTFSRSDYTGDKALTEVKISNNGAEKKFTLNYAYFESDFCNSVNDGCIPGLSSSSNDYYKRLKLLSVQENNNGKNLPPYTFEYNPNKLPVRNSKRQDWWGYSNGIGGDGSIATPPAVEGLDIIPVYSGDQPASLEHTKAWVLDKIHYPTGGNTRFYYELNDGYYETTYRTVGGLRLSQQEDFDPTTNKKYISTYAYTKTDNTSSGRIQTIPQHSTHWTVFYVMIPQGPVPTIYYIHYLNETLYPSQTLTYNNGNASVYSRVTVKKESGSGSMGHTVYEYKVWDGLRFFDEIFPFIRRQGLDWRTGLLEKESHFDAASNIVKYKENEFIEHMAAVSDTSSMSRNLVAGLLWSDLEATPTKYVYGARAYQMNVGRAELKKTTERIYASPGIYSENVTDFTYDAQTYLPTLIETKNSKQEIVQTRNYYPWSYTTTGLPLRTSMISANRVGEIVSQETWLKKNGTFYLSGAKVNDYVSFLALPKLNALHALERTEVINESVVGTFNPNQLLRTANLKKQVEYTSFDARGRYTGMNLPGNTNHALFWGVSNLYPVCQVVNAVYTDFAYTSFELDGVKGWSGINPGNIINSKGVTGIKYYSQSNFSFVATGLNTSTNYIVSYWSKNGSYTVSGNQSGWPKQGKTASVNGQDWIYYEHLVTGIASVYVTASGTGNIDELRLYPASAQMTSVAYNPLTGVTEQADIKDNIIFYQYDDFLRLNKIVDYQGNILKLICYNYYGQAEDCMGPVQAQWQLTGEVRCKPCSFNASYNSTEQERREKDINPASPTYNQYRWMNTGNSSSCDNIGVWISSSYCELISGQNTGNLINIQTDVNPCSPTYNQVRIVSIVSNQVACPPPGCEECASTGPEKKCISGNCETGVKIYTASVYNPNTGLYDCTYHYEWSDNSWSSNYVESSGGECPVL